MGQRPSKIVMQSAPEQFAKSRTLQQRRLLQRRRRERRVSHFVRQAHAVIGSTRDLGMTAADTLQQKYFKNQVRILRLLEWETRESSEVRPWRASLAILSWIAVFVFC